MVVERSNQTLPSPLLQHSKIRRNPGFITTNYKLLFLEGPVTIEQRPKNQLAVDSERSKVGFEGLITDENGQCVATKFLFSAIKAAGQFCLRFIM